jgi:hypothetical protein
MEVSAMKAESTPSVESPLHESSHLHLRALIKFTVWFVIGTVVVHLLIWWIFILFRTAVAKEERQITGVEAVRLAPPEPRLQPSVDHNVLPAADMAQLLSVERAELARRGWVDEESGEIRVPDEIVQKLAQLSKQK